MKGGAVAAEAVAASMVATIVTADGVKGGVGLR